MPVRLRPADPAVVDPALARFRDGAAAGDDLRLLTKHFLARARRQGARRCGRGPGAAVRRGAGRPAGARHTRGTPPAVVETRRRDLDRPGHRRPGLVRGGARRAAGRPPASAPTSAAYLPLVGG